MQLNFIKNVFSSVKMLNYYAFHNLQRQFFLLEDSEYLQNAFNL